MPSIFRASDVSRWIAAVVYATAILGALVVPHGHGWFGEDCCCSHERCVAGSQTAAAPPSSCSQGHRHEPGTTCCHATAAASYAHDHASPQGDGSSGPASPAHEDCPYCRFLAQPLQVAAAPVVLDTPALLGEAAPPALAPGFPAELTAPPARGPPAG